MRALIAALLLYPKQMLCLQISMTGQVYWILVLGLICRRCASLRIAGSNIAGEPVAAGTKEEWRYDIAGALIPTRSCPEVST